MATEQKSKTLNILLWAAQGLLALTLIWTAYVKLTGTAEWEWTKEKRSLATFTAVIDLLGGCGLILPALFRIQPKLTIYAAYGIILLMLAASVFHIQRGETDKIGINILFLLLAVFVAWGRSKKAVITRK